MKKTKKCVIAICVSLLLLGGVAVIYQQVKGGETLWGSFAEEHPQLVKKYPKWFDKNGDFCYPKEEKADSKGIFSDAYEEEFQIPDNLLNAMTTEQLINACARYPKIIRLVSYDTTDMALDVLAKNFNGMKELLERKDRFEVCYEQYISTDFPLKSEGKDNAEDNIAYAQYIELTILLKKKAYHELSEEQRKDVVNKTKENIKAFDISEADITHLTGNEFEQIIFTTMQVIDESSPWKKEFKFYYE